jgi:hypothetical protein
VLRVVVFRKCSGCEFVNVLKKGFESCFKKDQLADAKPQKPSGGMPSAPAASPHRRTGCSKVLRKILGQTERTRISKTGSIGVSNIRNKIGKTSLRKGDDKFPWKVAPVPALVNALLST